MIESTNGAVWLTWQSGAVANVAAFAVRAFAAEVETCSGIGWTNARHTIAMIVATVAQALTNERLIPNGSDSNPKATLSPGGRLFLFSDPCRCA